MKVKVIQEDGYEAALFGLGLSYGLTSGLSVEDLADKPELFERLKKVSSGLSMRASDSGHNKFLESLAVWIDVDAPRYWWQQFDTYRTGMSKQSESTEHTLLKKPLSQENFSRPIPGDILDILNAFIAKKDIDTVKAILPEAFMQRRILCTNYKVLRHIVEQRMAHRMPEWRVFCLEVLEQVKYQDLISPVKEEKVQAVACNFKP